MPSFREDLDRFLTNRESFARRDCLYVCETPAIMVALGMKQLPIYITQGHTADVLHPKSDENRHWHGLGKEELLAVPELLGSPAIIMDSISRADTVVFVLAATDADELPLIAAIRPDGESRYGCEVIPSNHLMSVYGKDDLCGFIERVSAQDKILFVDEEKTKDLANQAQLELLRGLEGLPMNAIIHPSHAVLRSEPPAIAPETDLEETMAEDRAPEQSPDAFKDAKRDLMDGKGFYNPESGFYVTHCADDEGEPCIVYYRKSVDELKDFVAVLESYGIELHGGAPAPSKLFLPDDFYVRSLRDELPFAIDAAAAQIAEGGWIEAGADVDDFLARCDGASPAGPLLPVVRQRGRLDVHGASPARRPSLDRDLKAAGNSARTQRLDSVPSMRAGKKHSEAEGM